MRRNHKLYTIKEFYPLLFWCTCAICDVEFKKEGAWKICFPILSRIICKQCAPTFKDTEALALTWGDRGTLRRSIRHTPITPPRRPN